MFRPELLLLSSYGDYMTAGIPGFGSAELRIPNLKLPASSSAE